MNSALSSSLTHTHILSPGGATQTHTRTTVPKVPPPLTSRHKSRKEIDSSGLVETFAFEKNKRRKRKKRRRLEARHGREGEGSEEKAERGSGKATGTRIEY